MGGARRGNTGLPPFRMFWLACPPGNNTMGETGCPKQLLQFYSSIFTGSSETSQPKKQQSAQLKWTIDRVAWTVWTI
jgi:hypothetical protein